MNAKDLFASVPFFADVLDQRDLIALALVAWPVEYDDGAVVMRQGARGDSLLVIDSGSVNVTVVGKPQPVAVLRHGDVVGEMSLLTGAPRSATVVAAERVTAYRVAKAQFGPILDRSPSLYDRFAAMVEKRNAELERVYGTGMEKLYFASRAQLVTAMRAFFGKAD
ncbi:MAG TPA: cyclic nucleotide-binding domain-containing protein [Bauldia sp.]|nr:cyclic nucleotide-binding domain-containing protein [Bauldia sp.]